MTKRRNFSDQFKAAVALEALRGDKTVQEIAVKRQLHPTQVSTWKRQAIEGMAGVFSDKIKKAENKDGEIKELHAKIGQLAVENDFFVRHQGFWHQELRKLRECPAHLVGFIMRRAVCDASVALRVSFV